MNPYFNYASDTPGITPFFRARAEEVRAMFAAIAAGFDKLPTPENIPGKDGKDGINGGVGSSAGIAGLFVAAAGMFVGAGITALDTSGYSRAGLGGARYIYDANVGASYVAANPRTAFQAAINIPEVAGKVFRLDPYQLVRASQLGAMADYAGSPTAATDNYAPLMAAMQFRANAAYQFGGEVFLDVGKYYCSQTPDPGGYVALVGRQGPAAAPLGGFAATWLVTPTNTTCIRLRSNDGTLGAANSRLSFITFAQVTKGDNLNAHAVDASCRVYLHGCTYTSIAGDGQHIEAYTDNGGRFGEASNSVSIDCYAHDVGGNGSFFAGADVNICYVRGFITQTCGLCGIYDTGYFVNRYSQVHLAGYGTGGVQYNGRRWQPIRPSIGEVPGSVTDGRVSSWYDRGALSLPNAAFPAWSNSTAYKAKCPIFASGPADFSAVYVEGGGDYGFCHGPQASVSGPNMGWTHSSAASNASGLVVRRGDYRSDSLTYPVIGEFEQYVFGWRGDGRPITQLSMLLGFEVKGKRTKWDWANDNCSLDWTESEGAGAAKRETFAVQGEGAGGKKGRRKTAPQNIFRVSGFMAGDRSEFANSRDVVVEWRNAIPTFGEWAQGDTIFNNSPVAGGWFMATCTTSGAIAAGPWVTGQYLLIGETRTSDGKVWVVKDRGPTSLPTSGQTVNPPSGPNTYTDPTSGMVWEPWGNPFEFKVVSMVSA